MLLSVHDEVVLEVPRDLVAELAPMVRETMNGAHAGRAARRGRQGRRRLGADDGAAARGRPGLRPTMRRAQRRARPPARRLRSALTRDWTTGPWAGEWAHHPGAESVRNIPMGGGCMGPSTMRHRARHRALHRMSSRSMADRDDRAPARRCGPSSCPRGASDSGSLSPRVAAGLGWPSGGPSGRAARLMTRWEHHPSCVGTQDALGTSAGSGRLIHPGRLLMSRADSDRGRTA